MLAHAITAPHTRCAHTLHPLKLQAPEKSIETCAIRRHFPFGLQELLLQALGKTAPAQGKDPIVRSLVVYETKSR